MKIFHDGETQDRLLPRLFEFALKIKGETTVGLASEG
jgi:hypothetical protein